MHSNAPPAQSPRQPWKPEVDVDAKLARRLIESQIPELPVESIARYGQGWDNIAYLINGEFVFRFPTRALGGQCMEHEIAVLPMMADQLPPLLPQVEFVGQASDFYPWPFSGYRELKGTTACSVDWTDHQRKALAIPLARFLSRLHSLPTDELQAAGAPFDEIGRMSPTRRIPQTREHLARAQAVGIIKTSDDFAPIISSFKASTVSDIVPVHGDLYVRHIVVDDNRQLVGLIDWGDVHLGDRAVDLSIAHTFLPTEAHANFRDAYGTIDDATWQRARFRSLQHTSVLAMYCHDVGDSRLLEECKTTLARLNSRT